MNPPSVACPQAPGREDSDLVAAVRRGEEAAFAEIHGRYAPNLEAYCARLLGSRHEAEDAVQQTFLKAHQSLRSNGNGIVLGPWLYTIARNESFTMLRARQRHPETELDVDLGPSAPGAGEMAETREELREMLEDLWRLPTQQREALVQTSLESAPSGKVAQSLGCEPAKVKSLVFRARAHMSDLRTAREMSCHEVKTQIAENGGATLRQRVIREHLRRCESCAELADRPRFRRKLIAPIILWPILTGKSIGGLGGAVESAAASTSGALAPGLGAKAVTAVAIVAAAGGVAANNESRGARDATPPPAIANPDPSPRAGVSPDVTTSRLGAPILVAPVLAAGQDRAAGEARPGAAEAADRAGSGSPAARDAVTGVRGLRANHVAGPSGHGAVPRDASGAPRAPRSDSPPAALGNAPPAAADPGVGHGHGHEAAAANPGPGDGHGAKAKSEPPVADAEPVGAAPSAPGNGAANASPKSRHARSATTDEAPVQPPPAAEPARTEPASSEPGEAEAKVPPGQVKNGKAAAEPAA